MKTVDPTKTELGTDTKGSASITISKTLAFLCFYWLCNPDMLLHTGRIRSRRKGKEKKETNMHPWTVLRAWTLVYARIHWLSMQDNYASRSWTSVSNLFTGLLTGPMLEKTCATLAFWACICNNQWVVIIHFHSVSSIMWKCKFK